MPRHPSTHRRRFFAVAVLLFLAAGHAAAQDADTLYASVGVAGGVALPFHGDFDFTARSWQADVRFNTTRHFGFALFFEEWRRTDGDVFDDQTLFGPAGPIGRVDRVTVRTAHRTRAVGASLLARATAGRVTVSGGGGVSYLLYTRDFRQTMIGCEPAGLCADSGRTFDNSSAAAQLQVGVDVAATRHIGLMGQFRLLVPVQDPGGGHDTVMGGVRFAF